MVYCVHRLARESSVKRRLSELQIGLDALLKRTYLPVPRNRNIFARFSGTYSSPVTMLTGLLQLFTSEFSLDYLNIPLYFNNSFRCLNFFMSFLLLSCSETFAFLLYLFPRLYPFLIMVHFFLCFSRLYISLHFLSMVLKIAKNIQN